ncbi:TIMELESS-interacting protein [Sarotherodon galilaeus]
MPLSVKTIKDRTIKMAENITRQQIKDISSAAAYSIACDESKDKSDSEQIALELIALKCQTRGEDICEAVLDCLRVKEIKTSHLVSVATDGAPSMTGGHRGFVAWLQKSLDRKLLTFHCILHQEALCAQTFPSECTEVINVINKIMAKGLNPSQFCSLLDEVESIYPDLLLYNRVLLSRGEVLKRFAARLGEVKTFMSSKGLTFSELEQPEWLKKLHFMVDMTANLNKLNTTLQGRGGTALHMLEEFREEKPTLSFPVTPLTIDPSLLNVTAFSGVSQPDLELELADIADKDMWVSKFKLLTEHLEDVAHQKATLVQNHKWSDTENLPRPDKLMLEIWNAIPDT